MTGEDLESGLRIISTEHPHVDRDRKQRAKRTGKLSSSLYNCNATHATRYIAMPLESTVHIANAVYVHLTAVWDWESQQNASSVIGRSRLDSLRDKTFRNYHLLMQPERAEAPFFFYCLEPLTYLPWTRTVGFDGHVSHPRSSALPNPDDSMGACSGPPKPLPYEPKSRTTIGIWVNNCDSPARNYVMDMLLASGLDVRSYGSCRQKVDPGFLKRGEDANGGQLRVHDNHPDLGKLVCTTHRAMLLMQHSACEDYVSNVCHAWMCGAVPIIHRIGGLPDYESVFGSFPHIDASEEGWLERVRRLMTDDAYYESFTGKGPDAAAPTHFYQRNRHCRWHGLVRAVPEKEVRIPRCVRCAEERAWKERGVCKIGHKVLTEAPDVSSCNGTTRGLEHLEKKALERAALQTCEGS